MGTLFMMLLTPVIASIQVKSAHFGSNSHRSEPYEKSQYKTEKYSLLSQPIAAIGKDRLFLRASLDT